MGFYPAAPGQRIAYDLDGTQVFKYREVDGANLVRQSTSVVKRLNDEWETAWPIEHNDFDDRYWIEFLFPKPYDMYGVWASGERDGIPDSANSFFGAIQTSNDVHVVQQGTWASAGIPDFRKERRYADWWRRAEGDSEGPDSFTSTASWGARGRMAEPGLVNDQDLRNVHWYGTLNDAYTPDRILALDKDTGLEFTTVHDWGDLPRGVVESKVIQIKNNSQSFQADGVTLGFNSLNSTKVSDWHEMKDGGGAFSTSLSLGNIAADTTYVNDITLRVSPSSNADLGPYSNRLTIGITGWT